MTTLKWDPKDPDEVIDYGIDFSDRLADGETIASVSWTVPDGLTGTSEQTVGNVVLKRLSAGTEGQTYSVTAEITTSSGQVMDQTAQLKIKSR